MLFRRTALEDKLVLGLGLVSIGLGVAEIISRRQALNRKPLRRLAHALDVRRASRRIAHLAQQRRRRNWLRKRVAFLSFKSRRSQQRQKVAVGTAIGIACAAAAGVFAARRFRNRRDTKRIHIKETITINRSAKDLYEFWRHFDRLPVIMDHLESVETTGENRTHWVAKAPAGTHLEWDAEIINEHPNELIAWRSLTGSDVDNAGTVRFEPAPGGRGTIVKVDMDYVPPGGELGAKITKLLGKSPGKQIRVDLRRFKQLMETGEIARTEGQSTGRAKRASKRHSILAGS